jgi:pimeloyl-ACP methyl ester carboxylesterase
MQQADSHFDVSELNIEQRVFISSDGTPIGYQVAGNPDGPALLLANGLGGTITTYRFILKHFSDIFRFYCWDYRGLYSSGRPIKGYAGLAIENHAEDGLELLKHEGVDTFHAFGWSMGVQVLLEMARTNSRRMQSLILHNGAAGKPYKAVLGQEYMDTAIPWLLKKLQKVDGLVTRTVNWAVDFPAFVSIMIKMRMAHPELRREVFLDVARGFQSIDLHLYMELLLHLGAHDASEVLEHITCPTLILAGSKDFLTPLVNAENLAQAIQNAQLEILPGGSHYAAVEFPDLINNHLEVFFMKHIKTLNIKTH